MGMTVGRALGQPLVDQAFEVFGEPIDDADYGQQWRLGGARLTRSVDPWVVVSSATVGVKILRLGRRLVLPFRCLGGGRATTMMGGAKRRG